MSKISPIVLFTYNRPEYTKQTMQALIANPLAKDSELFIYQDAPNTYFDTIDFDIVFSKVYIIKRIKTKCKKVLSNIIH